MVWSVTLTPNENRRDISQSRQFSAFCGVFFLSTFQFSAFQLYPDSCCLLRPPFYPLPVRPPAPSTAFLQNQIPSSQRHTRHRPSLGKLAWLVWRAHYLMVIASKTGWTEEFLLWQLPLSRSHALLPQRPSNGRGAHPVARPDRLHRAMATRSPALGHLRSALTPAPPQVPHVRSHQIFPSGRFHKTRCRLFQGCCQRPEV